MNSKMFQKEFKTTWSSLNWQLVLGNVSVSRAVFPHLNLQINVFCEKLSVCITALKSYSKIQWFKTIDIISDNSELLLGRSSDLLYWVLLGWGSLPRCHMSANWQNGWTEEVSSRRDLFCSTRSLISRKVVQIS